LSSTTKCTISRKSVKEMLSVEMPGSFLCYEKNDVNSKFALAFLFTFFSLYIKAK
jgi:hypothetical protein